MNSIAGAVTAKMTTASGGVRRLISRRAALVLPTARSYDALEWMARPLFHSATRAPSKPERPKPSSWKKTEQRVRPARTAVSTSRNASSS